MSDIIKLLPDSVANQIAAGEVIQRPASVVKELVENAADAGADNIQVIIKDSGRTLIQVVDNGKGMSVTDARMAFERHSTSKITVANDLFALRTMGFRGEALASIAAVAQVEMRTMPHGETLGTLIEISGSKVERQEAAATAAGTNMMVKNLFFNVPARRKFLKKDSVEFNNIMREFERLALVNPDVEMTIIHNDSVIHQLLRGSLKQRIGQLFGKSLEKQLIPIATETSIVKINGFVGLPENARKRGALQYLFVNGRNMRHPYFHKAIMHCYEQLIRPDEMPNYFVNFEVDPATIDVNIHPTKNEIKFENEQPIWQILTAAIRESLGRYNVAPSIDFDSEDMPDIPAFMPNAHGLDAINTPSTYNPFDTPAAPQSAPRQQSGGATAAAWRREASTALDDWQKLYSRFNAPAEAMPDEQADADLPSAINALPTDQLPVEGDAATPSVVQIKNKYLLTQNRGGIVIVDQHRAHVKVLYEQFARRDADEAMPSQKVMFPEVVHLTAAQNVMLREVLDDLERAGFELSFMGANSWAINGVPSADLNDSPADLLRNILDDLAKGVDITREGVRELLALSVARSAAIPSGRRMTATEAEHLLSCLFSLSSPGLTPDGLKVIAELRLDEIDRLF